VHGDGTVEALRPAGLKGGREMGGRAGNGRP
jgi:hypothetical protein